MRADPKKSRSPGLGEGGGEVWPPQAGSGEAAAQSTTAGQAAGHDRIVTTRRGDEMDRGRPEGEGTLGSGPGGMAVTNRAARYRRGSACPGLLRQQAGRA